MSIYVWIALGVIVGFVAGWNVSLHLPYYYHPQLRRRFKLSPTLKKKIKKGGECAKRWQGRASIPRVYD